MSENQPERGWRRRPYSIFGPLLLIAIGVVLFLKTLGVIDGNLWAMFLKAWPVLFIVGGLDSLYRGDGYVGGVAWAGFGALLLLGNLGYIQLAGWNVILRLWPFLFIVWGLDILFNRRNWWSAVAGILVGFGVLAVMAWMVVTAPAATSLEAEAFQTGLEDASRGVVQVEAITGTVWLGAGAEADNLVEGEVQTNRGEEIRRTYTVEDGTGRFELISTGSWSSGPVVDKEWRLELNERVPLEVTTQLIVGEQTLNLTGLQVEEVSQEIVIGKAVLYLPQEGAGEWETSVVIGELVVYVMPDTPLVVELDTAITTLQYPDDFSRDDDTLHSPAYQEGDAALLLRANLPIGSLSIRYVE